MIVAKLKTVVAGSLGSSLASSAFLAVGYCIGQGSAFLLQLALIQSGAVEAAGRAALFISLFSLCLQFVDLGNPTQGAHTYQKSRAEFHEFLRSRAFVGLILGSAVAVYFLSLAGESVDWWLMPLFGLAAYFFGCSETAKFEAARKYHLLAAANTMPWLPFAAVSGVALGYLSTLVANLAIAVVTLSVAVLSFRLTTTQKFSQHWGAVRLSSSLPYISTTLMGQVWGRVVFGIVVSTVGLAEFAYFSLVRQIQVALIVLFGFLIRPRLHLVFSEYERSGTVSIQTLAPQVVPLALALLVTVAGVLISFVPLFTGWVPAEIRQWMPLLIAVFPAALNLLMMQVNQRRLSAGKFLIVEKLGLALNVVLFLALVNLSGVLMALVFAESIGVFVTLASWIVYRKDAKA